MHGNAHQLLESAFYLVSYLIWVFSIFLLLSVYRIYILIKFTAYTLCCGYWPIFTKTYKFPEVISRDSLYSRVAACLVEYFYNTFLFFIFYLHLWFCFRLTHVIIPFLIISYCIVNYSMFLFAFRAIFFHFVQSINIIILFLDSASPNNYDLQKCHHYSND